MYQVGISFQEKYQISTNCGLDFTILMEENNV